MAHSELSPSGADRWSRCPGSVALCRGLPDSSSRYADEGTAAHLLGSLCLERGDDPLSYLDRKIAVGTHPECDFEGAILVGEHGEIELGFEAREVFEIDDDMVTNVGTYVDAVRQAQAAARAELAVEQNVSLAEVLPDPKARGTADAVILDSDTLEVHDLKYGRGEPVYAFDEDAGRPNPQLVLYALGAYHDLMAFTGARPARVKLAIHQPRVGSYSEHVLTLDELIAEGKRLARCAADTQKPNAPLVPGPKQCRWCKAKSHCPAIAQEVLATVSGATVDEFDDLTAEDLLPPDTLTDEQVGRLLAKLDWLEDWSRAVRARADRALQEGRPIPGWKLVAGRKGPRKWAEGREPQVIDYLTNTVRLRQDDIYTRKLVTPTQAGKLLGKVQFKRLEEFITQSAGTPAVAPASDPRPAVLPAVARPEEFFTFEEE